MKYSEVALSISPEEAAENVSNAIGGLRRTRDGERYVFKTSSGITLAVLEPASRREGGAILRYRTTMISPQLATARRKARHIRNALSEYQA